jgi:NADP-dependent aldehyde dehydrogenase
VPIRSVDPRSGAVFGPVFAEAGEREVETAVARAAGAQAVLGQAGPTAIAAALRAAADALDAERGDLAALADAETALGATRLDGEVSRTTGQLRAFADMVATGAHLRPLVSVMPGGAPAGEVRKINVPVGVVAVFAASNFPFAFSVVGGDTAAALAAGCAVIVKAHYGHPQTSQRVADLVAAALSRAGLPPDTVKLLHGGTAAGQLLAGHPGVAAVGFTGSTAGGRALADLAARRPVPIPVYAEQGSLNPVAIAPSAFRGTGSAALAAQLDGSVTTGAGQFCTKPGVLLVPADRREEFGRDLTGVLGAAPPAYLLTAKIFEQYEQSVAKAAAAPGVTVWRGSQPGTGFGAAAAVLSCDAGALVAETALREELFGPAVVVVGVRDTGELRAALRVLGGNLTGTVHGDPSDDWTTTALTTLAGQVGRLVYQGVPTGVAVVPAMHHGGPYPASSSARETSVGTDAIYRFLRPLAFQDFPRDLLPSALRNLH